MGVTKTLRENLGSGTINSTLEYIDGIAFEGLGSAGFDDNDFLIIGDDLDNFDLIGGAGHDEIKGKSGNDILKGGASNDTLKGEDGNDDLDGQQGTEKLFGGDGNDILRAGDGYDRLNGGTGDDIFGFYGAGHFEIADFKVNEDRLFFDSEILGIHSLAELSSYLTGMATGTTTNAEGKLVPYFEAEFIDGAATIKVVGASIDAITADMIMFNL